jgi:hypothetical protein
MRVEIKRRRKDQVAEQMLELHPPRVADMWRRNSRKCANVAAWHFNA